MLLMLVLNKALLINESTFGDLLLEYVYHFLNRQFKPL